MANKFVLVLHGGADVISKAEASVEQQFRSGMQEALEAGCAVLTAERSMR
jgi:isoaspartyl peptidase/L-asparaginase-like protein (Ntn-hydrolase superfamily)